MILPASSLVPDAAPPLVEVAGAGWADGAATGFLLARLRGATTLLWVQDRASRRERGRPYLPGFGPAIGGELRLLYLEVPRARDALWAMEEALGCAALSAVVGEVWGSEALDLTATRRLALRAQARGVAAWLLGGGGGNSAARERWHVAPLPSAAAPDDPAAPGEPRWAATLRRARGRSPGAWTAWAGPEGLVLGAPFAEAPEEAVARALPSEPVPFRPRIAPQARRPEGRTRRAARA